MNEPRQSLAVVSAGPSGLAAAHRLADTHDVWLFDTRSVIGGVWASSNNLHQQAYPWLETNTPTALFPFPGFPIEDKDWEEKDGHKKKPYVSGRAAQRYYTRLLVLIIFTEARQAD